MSQRIRRLGQALSPAEVLHASPSLFAAMQQCRNIPIKLQYGDQSPRSHLLFSRRLSSALASIPLHPAEQQLLKLIVHSILSWDTLHELYVVHGDLPVICRRPSLADKDEQLVLLAQAESSPFQW